MVAFASAEWAQDPIDPLAEAFAASGGSARIGRTISGGPDGEARWTAVVAAGAVAYVGGTIDDADVTFADTLANARAQLQGAVSPNACFMRGQTKVTGPTNVLLDVLAAGGTDAYEAARLRAEGRAEV